MFHAASQNMYSYWLLSMKARSIASSSAWRRGGAPVDELTEPGRQRLEFGRVVRFDPLCVQGLVLRETLRVEPLTDFAVTPCTRQDYRRDLSHGSLVGGIHHVSGILPRSSAMAPSPAAPAH